MKRQHLLIALSISAALAALLVLSYKPQTEAEMPVTVPPSTVSDIRPSALNPEGQSATRAPQIGAASKRREGLPLPPEAGQGPRPAVPPGFKSAPGALLPMPTSELGYVPVMVLDCAGMFVTDQQSQRQCEVGERKRLAADCAAAKIREAEATTDTARKTQRILVRSVCREAERYMGGE